MTAEEIKRLPNLDVTAHTLRIEGERTPALIVRQFGINVALVELEDSRASRIRVVSEQFLTPEGAHPGQRVQELSRIYGNGSVLTGEGNTVLTFPRAPGMSFLLDPLTVKKLGNAPAWPAVKRANPRVQMILLTGTAGEEAGQGGGAP